jgi:hypothetical protein
MRVDGRGRRAREPRTRIQLDQADDEGQGQDAGTHANDEKAD